MEKEQTAFGRAEFIKAEKEPSPYSHYDPAPCFRKEFLWEGDVGKARLFLQSPGFAKVYINGKSITEDLFVSPVSDYSKILWYNVYDVTELICRGVNVIGVVAGNGFFSESFDTAWHFPTAAWHSSPQVLLAIFIDGKEAAVTDGTWRVSKEVSPIIYNHLRSGEYYDARKRDDSWLFAGYDDSAWQSVTVQSAVPNARLLPTPCPPVREGEVLSPVSVTQTARGYLVDFGVNISGYMEITLCAERGREIVFRYAEEVDAEGNPKHNNMDKPHYYPESPFQVNKLIASGGADTFKPQFSYHGFRYVLIEGLEAAPDPGSVRAYFTHQDVARTSDFACGNDVLNYVYRGGIRSTYSNMFWGLTDCPTREKLGWTNDAQASVEQTLINFDILPLYEKWFEDLKADMREDGSLCGTVAAPCWDWCWKCGPTCDCLLYELPYRVYLYTGRTELLREAIPYFERYLAYFRTKRAEGHLFDLGDWSGAGSHAAVPQHFVQEHYYIKALRVTLLAHRLAGRDGCALERELAGAEEEFLRTYLAEDGSCTVDTQTTHAVMLAMGLYRERAPLARALVRAVEREGKITSGMVGVQYLYDALHMIGRSDLVYRLITKGDPGFLTWYKAGATTLWECWDGNDNGSHNHHMFSNVLAWFYKGLLGIAPMAEAVAFERVELTPCFLKELGYAKGWMETVKGRISAEWKWEEGGFVYTVTVPEGVTAVFRGETLRAGENRFKVQE